MSSRVGGRVPGITDVARLAAVSVGTVSNVLNNPRKVAPHTLTRVVDAIETLGFVRNTNARNLAQGTSQAIGLSLIDISNTLFVDIARGAQEAAAEAGLNLLLANADNDFETQNKNLAFLDGARVDGMLLAPMQDSQASIERVRRRGRPVVVINYVSDVQDACTVLVDNELVGYLAARHLLDLGRTRIAFVGGSDDLQPVHLRRAGARRAIEEEAGRISLEELSTSDLNEAGGRKAGITLAERPPDTRPDGVIAVTDLVGAGAIEELYRRGIAVPGDIAVMGCDYNSGAWGGSVPLTTVSMRGYDIGRESARLLIEEITSPPAAHIHRTVMLQPDLIERESTVGRPHPARGKGRGL
ncbi:LacI family DNA-binding transcriptional regulator [Leifsonia sp. NPDC058292]|uniref:LacI family DNA-binding transcriptional regulator n=1 Tax=Leifsonia sp. NPDC058292 TaxID=3346428 RepID=UPI0036DC3B32